MLRDLTVLTPPLVVCAAFLIAVGVFLKHEMGTGRRHREDDRSVDISADGGISGPSGRDASEQCDGKDASGSD